VEEKEGGVVDWLQNTKKEANAPTSASDHIISSAEQ